MKKCKLKRGKQNRFAFCILHFSIFNGAKRQGFTLIELTVVVFLIGVMLAVSIPRFRYSLITDNLKSTTRRIVGLITGLRNEAIREQKTYLLHFDIGLNQLWIDFDDITKEEREMAQKKAFQLPVDVRIIDVWTKGKGKRVDGEVSIRFSKKGYAEQTVIHLGAEDGREFTLLLNPFLAKIKSYDKYVDIGII
jgi:prepilin-type N-terminal cleavage/methylation domain-containing protein